MAQFQRLWSETVPTALSLLKGTTSQQGVPSRADHYVMLHLRSTLRTCPQEPPTYSTALKGLYHLLGLNSRLTAKVLDFWETLRIQSQHWPTLGLFF